MVSSGWWFLAAMIAAYGVANLLQSIAATRTASAESLDPGLLLRLFGHRTYLLGLGFQMFGFFLALGARRDLPLFLVQSAVTAGLCVTAVLGVLLLKWRLPPAEITLLGAVVLGITALASSAQPGHAEPLSSRGVLMLVVTLGAIAAVSVFAGRIKGVTGSVVLGLLAGLCFSSAAIAARPLAAAHSVIEFVTNPLLYLVIVHSLLGQLLLGLAMQRGSTNAAVASMDAGGAIPAAGVGLLFLGDHVRPGMAWLAGLGFVITLGAVIALTRYAEPQHELVVEPTPVPVRRTVDVPGLPPHPARGVFLVPGASSANCAPAAGTDAASGAGLSTPPVPIARQELDTVHYWAADGGDQHPTDEQPTAAMVPTAQDDRTAVDEPTITDEPTAAYPVVTCDGSSAAGIPVSPAPQPGAPAVEHDWGPTVALPLARQPYRAAQHAARQPAHPSQP